MNLYIRYFDEECVVTSIDEAMDFLSSLPGINVDNSLRDDLYQYMTSNVPYPKRYKVRPKVYFIVIKTIATTLAEFKLNGGNNKAVSAVSDKKDSQIRLSDNQPGWYEGTIFFKRVTLIPGTSKFQYLDTKFVARCKANNAQECYTRIVEHLRSRIDIDPRSQFPSMKGKNFNCEYLGMELP